MFRLHSNKNCNAVSCNDCASCNHCASSNNQGVTDVTTYLRTEMVWLRGNSFANSTMPAVPISQLNRLLLLALQHQEIYEYCKSMTRVLHRKPWNRSNTSSSVAPFSNLHHDVERISRLLFWVTKKVDLRLSNYFNTEVSNPCNRKY